MLLRNWPWFAGFLLLAEIISSVWPSDRESYKVKKITMYDGSTRTISLPSITVEPESVVSLISPAEDRICVVHVTGFENMNYSETANMSLEFSDDQVRVTWHDISMEHAGTYYITLARNERSGIADIVFQLDVSVIRSEDTVRMSEREDEQRPLNHADINDKDIKSGLTSEDEELLDNDEAAISTLESPESPRLQAMDSSGYSKAVEAGLLDVNDDEFKETDSLQNSDTDTSNSEVHGSGVADDLQLLVSNEPLTTMSQPAASLYNADQSQDSVVVDNSVKTDESVAVLPKIAKSQPKPQEIFALDERDDHVNADKSDAENADGLSSDSKSEESKTRPRKKESKLTIKVNRDHVDILSNVLNQIPDSMCLNIVVEVGTAERPANDATDGNYESGVSAPVAGLITEGASPTITENIPVHTICDLSEIIVIIQEMIENNKKSVKKIVKKLCKSNNILQLLTNALSNGSRRAGTLIGALTSVQFGVCYGILIGVFAGLLVHGMSREQICVPIRVGCLLVLASLIGGLAVVLSGQLTSVLSGVLTRVLSLLMSDALSIVLSSALTYILIAVFTGGLAEVKLWSENLQRHFLGNANNYSNEALPSDETHTTKLGNSDSVVVTEDAVADGAPSTDVGRDVKVRADTVGLLDELQPRAQDGLLAGTEFVLENSVVSRGGDSATYEMGERDANPHLGEQVELRSRSDASNNKEHKDIKTEEKQKRRSYSDDITKKLETEF